MKSLNDLNVKEKRVLIRCDFNVPLDESGNILDDFRIQMTIPTIEHLILQGAKTILMSHLGRPDGKIVESLSMLKVKEKLSEVLDLSVIMAPDCVGPETERLALDMKPGEVLMLENLRFHQEEEENDDDFAKKLAKLGEVYINDAFGASHRNHASIVRVPEHLPAAAGFLLEKEIKALEKIIQCGEKPLVAVMGGAKVETKARLINKISESADFVLIGGLIQKEIKEKGIQLRYPEKILGPIDELGSGLDIGPETVELFKEKISSAKTIFFNGVLGKVEQEEFSKGTDEILKAISESQAFSVIGGGDMTKVIKKLGLLDGFGHISTGGGAMLEFLSGDKLPGIEALK